MISLTLLTSLPKPEDSESESEPVPEPDSVKSSSSASERRGEKKFSSARGAGGIVFSLIFGLSVDDNAGVGDCLLCPQLELAQPYAQSV